MFEHVKVTGQPDNWIALPAGYVPGGTYERTAIGTSEALAMFREVNAIIGKLPRQPENSVANLIVGYSPVLLNDAKDGRNIWRELDSIKCNGAKVRVLCEESYDAHPAR